MLRIALTLIVMAGLPGAASAAATPEPTQWGMFTCGTIEQLQAERWVQSNIEIGSVSITDAAEYPYLGDEKHVYVSFAATNRSNKFAFAMLTIIGVGAVDQAPAGPVFALQATTLNGLSGNTTGSGFGFTYTEGNALAQASFICWKFGAAELF